MRLKNRKKSAAAIKSMKVGTDELKDLIKGAVKEAMGEEDDTGDDGGDAAAALDGITAEDMADIIEQAVDNANEKRGMPDIFALVILISNIPAFFSPLSEFSRSRK